VVANEPWDAHILAMQDIKRFSETVSERNQRREAEIAEALQGEARRHHASTARIAFSAWSKQGRHFKKEKCAQWAITDK
jgi:hypothetical protein